MPLIIPKIVKLRQGSNLPISLRDFHILVTLRASSGLSKYTISNILRNKFYGYRCKRVKEMTIKGIVGSFYKVLLKLK